MASVQELGTCRMATVGIARRLGSSNGKRGCQQQRGKGKGKGRGAQWPYWYYLQTLFVKWQRKAADSSDTGEAGEGRRGGGMAGGAWRVHGQMQQSVSISPQKKSFQAGGIQA